MLTRNPEANAHAVGNGTMLLNVGLPTLENEASSQFNVVYINHYKEKGEATKKVIGNIAFGDNGQFGVDKIDGNSTATSSYVYPAKPGYVMMVDYLKKQSQLGMKLVKLDS